MNDISKLTDHKKSIMLARLMGWYRPAGDEYTGSLWIFDTGGRTRYDGMFWGVAETFHPDFDLYKTEYIHIAWLVLNWACDQQAIIDWCKEEQFMEDIRDYWNLPLAEAQRLWLDKVLELAIEAGMGTEKETT